jgi:type I restriction enzyme M protein
VAAEAKVLRDYSLARKWRARSDTGEFVQTTDINDGTPPQVLFMERCIALVKPGGRIGVVAPESLLSSKSYRHVVQFIRAACDVLLVVGMPESLFKTSGKGGTHTKTSLLVLRKRDDANARRPQLFMAEAKWCGHDSRSKPILHDDLPTIANNYRAFQETVTIGSPSPLGFVLEQDDVRDHILAPRFYDPNLTGTLDSLRDTHRLVTMRELVSVGAVELRTGDEVGKLAYGTGLIPFIRTSDLSNWEIKVDPKHGLSREIYQRYRDKQDVRTGDILFVRDGTYLIGTCALVTQHDTEIVYQSHLYKIRVRDNDFGLDPFLLLAILNSDVVQAQIKSKRFTQDIIDSLGDRILDLVLPIPKSAKRRAEISNMVRKVIADRAEARELSRLVRRRVVET